MFESSCEMPFMNCLSTPKKICGSNFQVWIFSCAPVNIPVFISNWQEGYSWGFFAFCHKDRKPLSTLLKDLII